MIHLGKAQDMPVPLVSSGETVKLGPYLYIVSCDNENWYLNLRGQSNSKIFDILDIENPYKWCVEHHIQPTRTGGVFPWLSRRDISKAIILLRKEYDIKYGPFKTNEDTIKDIDTPF